MKNLKIRSIIGLALIYAAVFLELQWIWGILFLLWVLPDLFNGVTFFIEPVERKEHPLLYWAITVSWL
ncbi:MAG: VOC family protein, partial [Bacteroidota bacterium]